MREESYDEGKDHQVSPEMERRFHFRGFAQRVTEKIFELDDQWIDTRSTYNYHLVATIIAEHAYDLVYHTIIHECVPRNIQRHAQDYLREIPDLIEAATDATLCGE